MRIRFFIASLALSALLGATPTFATTSDLAIDGDWAAALGDYLATLEKNPDNAQARKGAWQAAMRLGLFDQAAELKAKLSPAEQAAMQGDQLALSIRYGIIDARSLRGPERHVRLDAVLAKTDALAAGLVAGQKPDAETARLLEDRVSALVARNRPADAVKLYETLLETDVTIPLWTRKDVAGAYLALRQPLTAEHLYREVLAASPDDFDANFGLFYALVESEKTDAATAHMDTYSARLPQRRHRDDNSNGERVSATIASDQARLYADRAEDASQRVTNRLNEMPFNGELRSAEASLHLARGWPRKGEADLRRNIGQDPKNPTLQADRAETLLTLQRWDEAGEVLQDANALAPDSPAVRRANETFELQRRPELYVDAGFGRGAASGPYGSSDWRVDNFLYSAPLAQNWRAFAHNYTASGDFDGQQTRWVRTGAGAEFRQGDWRATAEVNGGEGEQAGFLGTLRWQANDFWQVSAAVDSLTNDVPMQAVRAGVTAKRASLGVDWRASESRKVGLGTVFTDFSDGNQRRSLGATWFERWVSGPQWTLESTLGFDTSKNSEGYSAAYFNPPKDRSYWLTGAVEQLTWRDYDYSFRQRLALTVGNYWQVSYGNDSIEAIEYQQRWEIGRDLSLRYGVGRALRPYDGEREARNFATMTVLWRF